MKPLTIRGSDLPTHPATKEITYSTIRRGTYFARAEAFNANGGSGQSLAVSAPVRTATKIPTPAAPILSFIYEVPPLNFVLYIKVSRLKGLILSNGS